jgi:Cof subfamily protein (haloacid dehalogenase superfamily)
MGEMVYGMGLRPHDRIRRLRPAPGSDEEWNERKTLNEEKNGRPFEMCAFDLDGTLMRFDMTISDDTKRALDTLRSLGVRVVLATGRRYEGAREHAVRLGFGGDEPLVCYGGSMIRSINGETLLKNSMPAEGALEALEWAEGRGLHARIFVDGKIVTSPHTPAALATMANVIEDGVETVESPRAWLEESRENPIKVTIVDTPDDIEVWLAEAEKAFSDRFFVTRSLPHYVEIGAAEGMKSAALNFLCEKWGIPAKNVAAFGDGENDIDMLRFAGLGVAVGGMTDAVREAADEATHPVTEEGVARYIERILDGAGS